MHYLRNIYIEDEEVKHRETYELTHISVFGAPIQLLSSDKTFTVLNGASGGQIVKLPNALTMTVGQQIIIHNSSASAIDIDYFDGSHFVTLNPGFRCSTVLVTNANSNGVWARAITSASAFSGTAPILSAYNGNANTGRYLEIFPAQSSFDAPFTVPVNSSLIAVEYSMGATAAGITTMGIFKKTDLVTPIYSINIPIGQLSVINTDLNIPLNALDQICMRITSATAATKPRSAIYITGA
jgi:hypothetical protein